MRLVIPRDSLVRAGNRLARLLERRYDAMKRLGPDGYRASYGLLRALNGWRTAVAAHTASHARIDALEAKCDTLTAALHSIARNTCCDRCQEAALVAQAALKADSSRRR
jgi:hypothetical protein